MFSQPWGPSQSSLWVNRPLSYWEKQLMLENPVGPGPRRATLNEVFHLETKTGYEIELANFQDALRVTIYNDPHMRTKVDLRRDPISWIPADDFKDVFKFIDPSEGSGRGEGGGKEAGAGGGKEEGEGEGEEGGEEGGGLGDIWDIVEAEGNEPWDYDSGKPLYKCILVKLPHGYAVMHKYHHSIGDGSTGMLCMTNLMANYNIILDGKLPPLNPLPPRGSTEEETLTMGEEETCRRMLEDRIERTKFPDDYVPFDVEENKANDARTMPLMRSLFVEGKRDKFQALKRRCKIEKTTIGALATAAHIFGVSYVKALEDERKGIEFEGLRNHFTDIPVNVRDRVDPPLGPRCGFYVTEICVRNDVNLETNLWDLAREISSQLRKQLEEKRHLLFLQVREEWENGATASLAASSFDPNNPVSVVSNVGVYPGPKQFSWGNIKSVHVTGFLVHFLLLIQSTDIMCYNVTSLAGESNEATCRRTLEVVVDVMENVDDESRGEDLRSLLRRFGLGK